MQTQAGVLRGEFVICSSADFIDDCPFSYGPNEIEPPEPSHEVKGICGYCGEAAYTQNPKNLDEMVCWGCAYYFAN